MGWWCEVRGELTFLIAAPPWLLPSTSQRAASGARASATTTSPDQLPALFTPARNLLAALA